MRIGFGDEAAFRQLYRRHSPRMYRLALRLGAGDEKLAEEVLQESWIAAVPALHEFRWEAKLSTWLGGIVVHKVRDARRKGAHRGKVESRLAPEALQPTTTEAPAGARLDLERAIAALADGQRSVFVLHEVEGYTHEEIGNMLHISAGTSKSQLHDAKRELRQRLAAWSTDAEHRQERRMEGGIDG